MDELDRKILTRLCDAKARFETQELDMFGHIKIGPSFFQKAKNDYSDWRWAWVRELAQNGIDAPGTSSLMFEFRKSETETVASCENNGAPMTREILLEKFLAIGESGKNFQSEAVGGFGKAKELIAFAHLRYEIRTGSLLVRGCGAEYELEEGLEEFHGTRTRVWMVGDETVALSGAVRAFCSYAQWGGQVLLFTTSGAERLECGLKKGAPRRELSMGSVYSNKSHSNLVVVRIKGVPMFTSYTAFARCVIVELSGSSLECLTSNRDGLVWAKRRELEGLLEELATDKRSALRKRSAEHTHYVGEKLRVQTSLNVKELVQATAENRGVVQELAASVGGLGQPILADPARVEAAVQRLARLGVSQIQEDFVVRNDLELKVPEYYLPDSAGFGMYARKLAKVWGRLLVQLYRVFKLEGQFSIGFCFSDEAEAMCERHSQFGLVYYVNPSVVVRQARSEARSLAKRFKLTERERLLSLAVHELLHGAYGLTLHNEDFSTLLTDTFAKVLKERKSFNWCFGE